MDVRHSRSGGAGASVDHVAVAEVVTPVPTGSVVPLSLCLTVVGPAWVLRPGLLGVKGEVVCGLGTVVTSRAPALVWRVVGSVVAAVPAVDSWRRLDGVVGGTVAADERGAQPEAVEGRVVCSAGVGAALVASVGECAAAVLPTLLRSQGVVAAGGGVARVVVVGAVVLAAVEARTVSSSVT